MTVRHIIPLRIQLQEKADVERTQFPGRRKNDVCGLFAERPRQYSCPRGRKQITKFLSQPMNAHPDDAS